MVLMIIQVSDLQQMKKILAQMDNKKYVCYFIPLQAMYFRPNVTTKGRDTYKFTDCSLSALQSIKEIWGEDKIFTVSAVYNEDALR